MSIKKPLQRLQNHCARVLTGTSKQEHITPVLKELHWLPVKERTEFKLLTMVHNSLHNEHAPKYLKNMFRVYEPTRPLRSGDDQWTIAINDRTMRHEGHRCASNHGATVWNSLPFEIRSEMATAVFKKKLKTFLFQQAYT